MVERVKASTIAVAAVLAILPAAAQAGDFYAEAYGGAAFSVGNMNWDGDPYAMETGFNSGGSLGMHVAPHWDLEIDGFYANMNYACCAPNDLSGLSLMANGIYDFDLGWFLDPYFGAGLGAVRVHYNGLSQYTGSDWRFGYQVMAGVMADVSPRVGVFTEYRFNDAVGRATLDSPAPVSDVEYQSHNISAGLRLSY